MLVLLQRAFRDWEPTKGEREGERERDREREGEREREREIVYALREVEDNINKFNM